MLLWLGGLTAGAWGSPPACNLREEPAGVAVLTVDPGDSVASAFGHAALLLWDPTRGARAPVYDFGRYRSAPPLTLAWEMLRMELPYFMSRAPLGEVVARYRAQDRRVVVQLLNLERHEVVQIGAALHARQAQPEYAYHWFRANCATQLRDLVDAATGGELRAVTEVPSKTSAAAEVLRHAAPRTPLWFGLQWGSGEAAHQPLSRWDAMLLPDGLMNELAAAARASGEPLVRRTCTLLPSERPRIAQAPPARTGVQAGFGLGLGGAVLGASRVSRRAGLVLTALVGLLGGLLGVAALIIGQLGTFAPFWGHHNQWLVNPGWLLLVPAASWAWRRPADPGPRWVAGALVAVAGLGLLGALLRGFADHNAGLVALVLPPLLAAAWSLRPPPV